MALAVVHHRAGPYGLVLRVEGEIDLASARMLEQRLHELAARSAAFTVDLRRVSYMDSTGLQALESAADPRMHVTILVAPGAVSKLLRLDLLDDRFSVQERVNTNGDAGGDDEIRR